MLSFIEKTHFNKSSSPDREEWTSVSSGRDGKDSSSTTDTESWRAAISQVVNVMLCKKSVLKCCK